MDNMPLYESSFICRQDMSQQDVEKLTEVFAKIITDNGGTVAVSEYWGIKNLAYPIKKNKKGHYVMFALESPYSAVKEMERRMKLSEDILRNITFRIDSLPEGPSCMLNKEQEIDVPALDVLPDLEEIRE